MSIFNAEALAILEEIKATRRWRIAKKIILTDSLSNLMAQEKIYTRGNSKIAELKDLLAEERANLKIMWIRTCRRSSNRTQSGQTGLLPLG
jgi:hypothetical protein